VSAAGAIAVTAVAALACACSPGHFDDLRDQAWSDSGGAPDGVGSNLYPVAVAPLATGAPGVHVVVAGSDPVAVATVSYDASGSLDASGVELTGVAGTTIPTLATVVGAAAGARPWVAVGGLGTAAVVQMFDARTGVDGPLLVGSLDVSLCGGGGADLGRHMVWVRTVLGDPTVPDLIATAGNDLVAFPDLDPTAASHPCFRCTAVDAGTQPRDVLAVAAADMLPSLESELIVTLRDPTGGEVNRLHYFAASTIQTDDGGNCFSTSVSSLPDLPASDFGAAVVAGDLDGDGFVEVIAAVPSAGIVRVFPGVGESGPSGPTFSLTAVTATSAFGAALAIGDVDGDGKDDLVVGDPDRTMHGANAAGAAVLFGPGSPSGLLEREPIAPARSSANEHFGRVLAIAPFTGPSNHDLLVAGTIDSLFVYFRAVAGAADPRD